MVFFLVDRLQTFVDWDSLEGLIVLREVSIILVVSMMGRDDGLSGRLELKHRLCNLLNIVNRPLTIQGDLDVSGARIIDLDVAVEGQSPAKGLKLEAESCFLKFLRAFFCASFRDMSSSPSVSVVDKNRTGTGMKR
jgi:hypothetical protein